MTCLWKIAPDQIRTMNRIQSAERGVDNDRRRQPGAVQRARYMTQKITAPLGDDPLVGLSAAAR